MAQHPERVPCADLPHNRVVDSEKRPRTVDQGTVEDRWLALAPGTCQLPERLLLAHARGEVLFITGAGISMPSRLPDFKDLVLKVYENVDLPAYTVLSAMQKLPGGWSVPANSLSTKQLAEVERFKLGEYDVVLGMLERRIDSGVSPTSSVRTAVVNALRHVKSPTGSMVKPRPSVLHKALLQLSDRGGVSTIATTNFDLLLEAAKRRGAKRIRSFALGGVPRPGRRDDFCGVLHIHGGLSRDSHDPSELVVTDRDFGEFYLRRRVVPDFIYDAARLFNLVLVGYSASDAPMKYLLNAVAADGMRFTDLRERFAFVAMPPLLDQVQIEDWKGRGITPIPYSDQNKHAELSATIAMWAEFSAINGDPARVDREIKRIVAKPRPSASEADRDLFDHLVRRMGPTEKGFLSATISASGADISWLTAMLNVSRESARIPP